MVRAMGREPRKWRDVMVPTAIPDMIWMISCSNSYYLLLAINDDHKQDSLERRVRSDEEMFFHSKPRPQTAPNESPKSPHMSLAM
jgi:hypothetical protein